MQFRLLSLRQSEELLPKALACGTLPQPIGDLGWCYASYPLGEHLEEDDTPDLVLSAIAKVALALGRLARVSAERSALLHRCGCTSIHLLIKTIGTCVGNTYSWRGNPGGYLFSCKHGLPKHPLNLQ